MKVMINIYPKENVLNPEAETVNKTLENLGFDNLKDLSIGKNITFYNFSINTHFDERL